MSKHSRARLDRVELYLMGEIAEERIRQFKKWGLQDHSVFKWLVILGEEVGEANKAALGIVECAEMEDVCEELIQVAAVAISAILALRLRAGGKL